MKFTGRFDYAGDAQPVKVDLKDRKILSLLVEDARTPLTQIAKKVGLSRDAVDYRIKRLQQDGIILGFFPNVSFSKLGYKVFHFVVLIDENDPKKKQDFVGYLKTHPNVASIIEYSDNWDFDVMLLAKDVLEFDTVMLDLTTKFSNIVIEKNRLELIKRFKITNVPPLLRMNEPLPDHYQDRVEKAELDTIDFELLKLLLKDCRTSTYILAENLGVSADTVSYRIKQLVKKGVLKNFTILMDLSKLEYHWYTYTIGMKFFDRKNEAKFEAFLAKNRNIIRATKILGPWDLFLHIVVENQREFHRIITDLKNVFADVIKRYETWVGYKEHYFNPLPKCLFEKK